MSRLLSFSALITMQYDVSVAVFPKNGVDAMRCGAGPDESQAMWSWDRRERGEVTMENRK